MREKTALLSRQLPDKENGQISWGVAQAFRLFAHHTRFRCRGLCKHASSAVTIACDNIAPRRKAQLRTTIRAVHARVNCVLVHARLPKTLTHIRGEI